MLRYTPLSSPSAIRLLSWNGTSYILQDADLDDGPEYEALSYCWSLGDGNDEGGHIICDGQQLKVMANLRDGLERLRAAGRFGPVWIDAVCINQDDLPERGAQVEMMDRIFGSAKAVIVWLGKQSHRAGNTNMRYLEFIARLPTLPRQTTGSVPDSTPAIEALRQLEFETSTTDWLGVGNVFALRWFTRAWIIQEAVLARRLLVYYDEFESDWDALYNGMRLLQAVRARWHDRPSLHAQGFAGVNSASRIMLARDCYHHGERWPLHKYIDVARAYAATDLRDKVFALLSIAKPDTTTEVVPRVDYSKSTEEVYTECALYLLHGDVGLGLLSMVEDKSARRFSKLASWVPDFSVPQLTHPFEGFSAATAHAPKFHLAEGSILTLEASKFDVVDKVAEDFEELEYAEKLTRLLQIATRIGSTYPDGTRTIAAFCNTLTAYAAGPDVEAQEGMQESFRQWLVNMFLRAEESSKGEADILSSLNGLRNVVFHAARRSPRSEEHDGSNTATAIARFIEVFEELSLRTLLEDTRATVHEDDKAEMLERREKASLVTNAFLRVYNSRKLFGTRKGYLGLGPQSMKASDVVALVFGASVPLIVRSAEASRHTMVGETYVHGLMHGECPELDRFTLCLE